MANSPAHNAVGTPAIILTSVLMRPPEQDLCVVVCVVLPRAKQVQDAPRCASRAVKSRATCLAAHLGALPQRHQLQAVGFSPCCYFESASSI